MGPVVDNNKTMRCEYILMILYITVSLLDGLIISSQLTIVSIKNSGCIDYVIKKMLDDLLKK